MSLTAGGDFWRRGMETRLVRGVRVLLPSVEDAELTEMTSADPAGLRYRKVGRADWSRLNVVGASVTGSRFSGTTLRESRWEESTITGVLFEQADLSSARWEEVKVERTAFLGCQLSGFSLTGAGLGNVIFENCRLDYATFHGVRATGPVAFVNCTLTEASLSNCRLNDVVFDQCRLAGTEFDSCDLRGADLRGNPLDSIRGIASLRGVKVTADQLTDLARALPADLELQLGNLTL